MKSTLHDAERAVDAAICEFNTAVRLNVRGMGEPEEPGIALQVLRATIRALADATRDEALRELRDATQQRHDDTNRCHEEQEMCAETRRWCIDFVEQIDALIARERKPAAGERGTSA